MPVNLDNQQQDKVILKPEESRTVDYDGITVEEFVINDAAGRITIIYKRSLAGVEIDERFQKAVIQGAPFGAVALVTPPPGKTRRDDLKTIVYNLLLTELGFTGTVS